MAKGLMCIGLSSVIIVILFFVMCYLMSGVNPPPLKSDGSKDEIPSDELKFENVIFDDEPSAGEQPQYELEKVNVDNAVIVTIEPTKEEQLITTVKNYSIWRYTPRKVVPPVWPTTTFAKTWPTNTATKTTPSNSNRVQSNQTHGLAKSKVEQSESLPIKGHRRSISSLKNDDDNPAYVILKIIDSSGDSRIEIKLGSDNSARRKKNGDNQKSPLKNKSKFSMTLQTYNKDQIKKRGLAKNTIISIMPNDTIVVDEYERILSDEKNKTKEITQNEGNITNEISSEVPLSDVTNSTIHNITDYEDVLFTKSHDNRSIEPTETIENNDSLYTHTFSNDNETNSVTEDDVVKSETYTTGLVETEPSNTFNTDEDLTSITFEISTEKQEYSIMPTLTDFQTENVLNNDISNTVLDEFAGIQNSTEESRAITNISISDENVSELITTITAQDINLTDLKANISVQIDSSSSPVTDVTISNVQSFDLLSELDALSENSTLTAKESISQYDNISVPITEPAIKRGNSTILATNLTFQDELQIATITNVAIQNDNSIASATNQNEDLVLTTTDWAVPNENANIENKTGNNLV